MKFSLEDVGLVVILICSKYVIVWIINACIWLYKKYEDKKYEKDKLEEEKWFKNNSNALEKIYFFKCWEVKSKW